MERISRPFVLVGLVLTLVLVAAACSSSAEDDFRAELRDEGLSDESIDCVIDTFEDAGVDLDNLDDLDDVNPLGPGAAFDMGGCMQDVFAQMFGAAFDELGTQLEEGFSEGFGDADTTLGFASPAELDELADACRNGDNTACDDLWLSSPIDSPEERLAESCGGRSSEPRMGSCAFWLDG